MSVTDKERKQMVVLDLLLSARPLDDVATSASITQRTIYRWMQEPDFSASLMDRQRCILRDTSIRLAGMSACALGTLDSIISDPDVAAGIRARTCERILSETIRYSETVNLHDKLVEVEAKLSGKTTSEG